jgi:hypothetical protein
MDEELNYLLELVAAAVGQTPDQLRADIARKRARAAHRAGQQNRRYYDALTHVTPKQAKKVQELRQGGATLQSRIRQDRRSLNVAMFLHQDKWDSAKGRMGSQMYAVYPDGSVVTTFEKSISVKSSF